MVMTARTVRASGRRKSGTRHFILEGEDRAGTEGEDRPRNEHEEEEEVVIEGEVIVVIAVEEVEGE